MGGFRVNVLKFVWFALRPTQKNFVGGENDFIFSKWERWRSERLGNQEKAKEAEHR